MTQLQPTPQTALVLAVCAVAVNGPRLVLAFLEADGIAVSPSWRALFLGLTGVATGVVLTGGGAYLAHALAQGAAFRRTLTAAWLSVLACSAVLVTPMMVAGLAHEPLAAVLPSQRGRWIWAATAVLAVELVAAGAMVAHVARQREHRKARRGEQELFRVAAERDRLAAELRRRAEPREEPAPPATLPGAVSCRHGCGAVFASVPAERGHLASCPQKSARS